MQLRLVPLGQRFTVAVMIWHIQVAEVWGRQCSSSIILSQSLSSCECFGAFILSLICCFLLFLLFSFFGMLAYVTSPLCSSEQVVGSRWDDKFQSLVLSKNVDICCMLYIECVGLCLCKSFRPLVSFLWIRLPFLSFAPHPFLSKSDKRLPPANLFSLYVKQHAYVHMSSCVNAIFNLVFSMLYMCI